MEINEHNIFRLWLMLTCCTFIFLAFISLFVSTFISLIYAGVAAGAYLVLCWQEKHKGKMTKWQRWR